MLLDLAFLGLPMFLMVVTAFNAVKDADARYWRASACMAAYCVFYVLGGREIILYILAAQLKGLWVLPGEEEIFFPI